MSASLTGSTCHSTRCWLRSPRRHRHRGARCCGARRWMSSSTAPPDRRHGEVDVDDARRRRTDHSRLLLDRYGALPAALRRRTDRGMRVRRLRRDASATVSAHCAVRHGCTCVAAGRPVPPDDRVATAHELGIDELMASTIAMTASAGVRPRRRSAAARPPVGRPSARSTPALVTSTELVDDRRRLCHPARQAEVHAAFRHASERIERQARRPSRIPRSCSQRRCCIDTCRSSASSSVVQARRPAREDRSRGRRRSSGASNSTSIRSTAASRATAVMLGQLPRTPPRRVADRARERDRHARYRVDRRRAHRAVSRPSPPRLSVSSAS